MGAMMAEDRDGAERCRVRADKVWRDELLLLSAAERAQHKQQSTITSRIGTHLGPEPPEQAILVYGCSATHEWSVAHADGSVVGCGTEGWQHYAVQESVECVVPARSDRRACELR